MEKDLIPTQNFTPKENSDTFCTKLSLLTYNKGKRMKKSKENCSSISRQVVVEVLHHQLLELLLQISLIIMFTKSFEDAGVVGISEQNRNNSKKALPHS